MSRAPGGDRPERDRADDFEGTPGRGPVGPAETAPGSATAGDSAEEGPPGRKPSRYLAGRMVGAARLDRAVIRAVRDDRFATFQALQVVLLAALSAAMSATLPGDDPRVSLAGAVIAWLAWVFFAHLTATRALGLAGSASDWNWLLRTAGMALAPAVLLLFSRIPIAGLAFLAAGAGWTAVAMTGAVRHTYDEADWSKAIQASVVGWLAAGIAYFATVLINEQIRGS